MSSNQNSHRNSKQAPAASSTTIPTRNIFKHRIGKSEKLLKAFNLISLLITTILISVVLFLYCRTLYEQKKALKSEKYEEVKSLNFGTEINVIGYSNDYLLVNVKCAQFCSCLLYTERLPFGDAAYTEFWEIASESKATNISIHHIEKTKTNNSDNGTFLTLLGSNFYKYQFSCAMRSANNIVPEKDSITKDNVKVFSKIITYSKDIIFKNSTETILKRAKFIYDLKTNPSSTKTKKVGKMTNYIIPKEFKLLLGLKVRKNTSVEIEEDLPSIGNNEKEHTEEKDDDTENDGSDDTDNGAYINPPVVSDDTIVDIENSSLFNVQLVYKKKTPSILKITGWIPKSLHLVCVIESQTRDNDDLIFQADSSKFESVKNSPQFNSFTVSTYAKSAHNKVILAERKADTFLDLNNASPTKFILKLVGVAPGKHLLSCGVSNIDKFESLEFTSATNRTEVTWLKVLEADVYMPYIKAKNDEAISASKLDKMSKYPDIFEWFLSAGYEDLYLLFDKKVLNKEGSGILSSALKTISTAFKRNSEKDEGKEDTYALHKIIEGIMKDIKVIVNGNLFKKTDLDAFYLAINTQITKTVQNTKSKVINVEMGLIIMLKIMKSLTLLSTVPMDNLADMNFKYYRLWSDIKSSIKTVSMWTDVNESEIDEVLKRLVLDLLRLQVIILRVDLFGENEVMVKETIKDLNREIISLTGCNEKGLNAFSNCKSENIKNGIKEVIENNLVDKTTSDLLNIDMDNSELGIWK